MPQNKLGCTDCLVDACEDSDVKCMSCLEGATDVREKRNANGMFTFKPITNESHHPMYQGSVYCNGELPHPCAYLCHQCWAELDKRKQPCPWCRKPMRPLQRLPERRRPRVGLADTIAVATSDYGPLTQSV